MSQPHAFGGVWTRKKLECLEEYLKAYLNVMKGQPFKKAYIDAFAGTGYQAASGAGSSFWDSVDVELAEGFQAYQKGSTRIALELEPSFDSYIFIESIKKHAAELAKLRQEYTGKDIQVIAGDANIELRRICNKDWRMHRAVLFLDHYGMQVDWSTIECIEATKAIDLWVLFPAGVGVNRLLRRDAEIDQAWKLRLNRIFGTEQWYDAFYDVRQEEDLFDSHKVVNKTATIESITAFYNGRLRELFGGKVLKSPIYLGSGRKILYSLLFAVGNERGARPALRIANHIVGKHNG